MTATCKATERKVIFEKPGIVTLQECAADNKPLKPTEILGSTVCSLVSPGTELAMLHKQDATFPQKTGYACIFRVEEWGDDVKDVEKGELFFYSGFHQSRQRCKREDAIKLPAGIASQEAVFARLMAVSMSTLVTTTARPASTVIITGLGLVGNLAAQIFQTCGYRTIACDPQASRRELAHNCGIKDIRQQVPLNDESCNGKVSLVVECSGHEQAVLDACKIIAKRGEVVMIGVPWRKLTDIAAFELLREIFHRYAVLRSGWEWEVPGKRTDFTEGNIQQNYVAALNWIAEGRIKTEPLAEKISAGNSPEAYEKLQKKETDKLSYIIDWES